MEITINNKRFFLHPRKKPYDFYGVKKSLYDCYQNPSAVKVAIYEEWKNYCKTVKGFDFCITSYNTFHFCVAFKFWLPDGLYLAHITPSCNHLYRELS